MEDLSDHALKFKEYSETSKNKNRLKLKKNIQMQQLKYKIFTRTSKNKSIKESWLLRIIKDYTKL